MTISFSTLIGRENFSNKSGRDVQARVMPANNDSLDSNKTIFHTY